MAQIGVAIVIHEADHVRRTGTDARFVVQRRGLKESSRGPGTIFPYYHRNGAARFVHDFIDRPSRFKV